MADIILPVCGGTAKVWVDGGLNYICVEGENAFVSGTTAYSNAAVGIYIGGATPPTTFPGVGGTGPTIVETTVNTDGTFNFTSTATYPSGAAGALHSPYPSNKLGLWCQDSNGVWSDLLLTCTFSGKDANSTDCAFADEELADDGTCTEQLVVDLPVPRNVTRVVDVVNGVGSICVRGGNAIDEFKVPDKAVAAKIYPPSAPMPLTPPLADPDLRVTRRITGQYCEFEFSVPDMLVPGALAKKGRPLPCNKLVLWPQFDDGSWGAPKPILFYGRTSSDGTDCDQPIPYAAAEEDAASDDCGCGKHKSPPAVDEDAEEL